MRCPHGISFHFLSSTWRRHHHIHRWAALVRSSDFALNSSDPLLTALLRRSVFVSHLFEYADVKAVELTGL